VYGFQIQRARAQQADVGGNTIEKKRANLRVARAAQARTKKKAKS